MEKLNKQEVINNAIKEFNKQLKTNYKFECVNGNETSEVSYYETSDVVNDLGILKNVLKKAFVSIEVTKCTREETSYILCNFVMVYKSNSQYLENIPLMTYQLNDSNEVVIFKK